MKKGKEPALTQNKKYKKSSDPVDTNGIEVLSSSCNSSDNLHLPAAATFTLLDRREGE